MARLSHEVCTYARDEVSCTPHAPLKFPYDLLKHLNNTKNLHEQGNGKFSNDRDIPSEGSSRPFQDNAYGSAYNDMN